MTLCFPNRIISKATSQHGHSFLLLLSSSLLALTWHLSYISFLSIFCISYFVIMACVPCDSNSSSLSAWSWIVHIINTIINGQIMTFLAHVSLSVAIFSCLVIFISRSLTVVSFFLNNYMLSRIVTKASFIQ